MLSKAFEWCRIANVNPNSSMVNARSAAASEVLDVLDEAEDSELALNCAVGLVAGFDTNFTSASPIVQTIVGAIRGHESAFPQDILENALELRACTGIALGEMLVRDSDEGPDVQAQCIASVLRSGLGMRRPPSGKHLRQLLDELDAAAAKVLSAGALAKRQRADTIALLLEKVRAQAPTDSAAAWEIAVEPLRSAIEEIVQQSAIDREEINILWWMFAGPSTTTGQPIADMPAGAAALFCGAELGSRCLLPALPSHEAMVRRAYETGRQPQELDEKSLEKIAADWQGEIPRILLPDDGAAALVQAYPSLFPLSWLCSRLVASKGSTDWTGEFERLTGISPLHTCSPAKWAIQAFRERVAYRAHAEWQVG